MAGDDSWLKLEVVDQHDHEVGACEPSHGELDERVAEVIGVDLGVVGVAEADRCSCGSEAVGHVSTGLSRQSLVPFLHAEPSKRIWLPFTLLRSLFRVAVIRWNT